MNPAAPAAELRGVSFGYRPGSMLLDDVDLRIEADDLLGIVGPNGSGKTTLLKLLLGLLEPRRGEVEVFGRRPEEARHRIGYVPQHAAIDRSVPATALDVVLMGRLRHSSWGPSFGKRDVDAARQALQSAGGEALAGRPLAAMSGGERQRVLIARALAGEPELLLLDEPTTGVDFHAEQELMRLLLELNRRVPIVMVSHDVVLVSAQLKRVACVSHGVSIHPAHEITAERLSELYSGPMAVVDHRHSEGEPQR